MKRHTVIITVLNLVLGCTSFVFADGQYVESLRSDDTAKWQKAAEQGNANAMFNLGLMYKYGWGGVMQDYNKTMALYLKAATVGNTRAMLGNGWMYKNGQVAGKNGVAAFEWFQKAAYAGNAGGMYNLGFAYEYGDGVEKDLDMAIQWYNKASEKGNSGGMFALGNLYLKAKGWLKIRHRPSSGTKRRPRRAIPGLC